jgi:hypothetical protein
VWTSVVTQGIEDRGESSEGGYSSEQDGSGAERLASGEVEARSGERRDFRRLLHVGGPWVPLAAAASVDGLSTGGVSDQVLFVWRHAPHRYFLVQSIRTKRVKSGLSSADFAVKGEGPAFGRVLFSVFYLPLILAN